MMVIISIYTHQLTSGTFAGERGLNKQASTENDSEPEKGSSLKEQS